MNITSLLNTLAAMVAQFYPQQMDPSLKPKNSAGCLPCRKTVYDFIVVGAGTAGNLSDTFLPTVSLSFQYSSIMHLTLYSTILILGEYLKKVAIRISNYFNFDNLL